VHDLLELVAASAGARPEPVDLGPDDVAILTYTSGTTGPPKGAMNTHRNVVFDSCIFRNWMHVADDDVILGIAPLFHITGLIAHIGLALSAPAPLVLAYRFDAAETLRVIEAHRTTVTVAAITAFLALLREEGLERHDVSSLTKAYSGGGPIPPSVVEEFERRTGVVIRSAYGLTETTSASHLTPLSGRAPTDAATGALAVGIPVFNTSMRILDDDGRPLATGEVGEVAIAGPQVVPGYWNKPEETAHAIRDGELRTGDVGKVDAEGWLYIVDRKKDMIVASGYKVWPREVEDVIYEHPAVHEAAVVGAPDEYRGETVRAFVSLKPGTRAEPAELIGFCRERLAAYKCPRSVDILDELPKTVSGKILRRELRRAGSEAVSG
jgi:long-chain acyl-CoA synthetase